MEKDDIRDQDPNNPENKDEETDWKAEAQKYKAMADRRAKKLADLEKKEPKPNAKKTSKEAAISQTDMSYYFAKGGTRTGLRKLRQIMAGTGKSFDEALKSDLYKGWELANKDALNKIKSQLGPSRGGSPAPAKEHTPTKEEKEFLKSMGVKDKK